MRTSDAITEQAYRRQIAHTRAELSVAEALRTALIDQTERRRKWTLTANSVAKRASQLGDNIESGVKALRQVQSKRAGLESQVCRWLQVRSRTAVLGRSRPVYPSVLQARGIRDRIGGIDAKTPQLNEEKRVAVNERKFKEAGRLTSELKRLADEREVADK